MKESQLRKFLIDSWYDEKEATMLYEQMALGEADPKKKNVYQRLADIERGHAELLEIELEKLGVEINKHKFKPRWRTRFLSLFGRIFGHTSLLRSLVKGEDGAIAKLFKSPIIGDFIKFLNNLEEGSYSPELEKTWKDFVTKGNELLQELKSKS